VKSEPARKPAETVEAEKPAASPAADSDLDPAQPKRLPEVSVGNRPPRATPAVEAPKSVLSKSSKTHRPETDPNAVQPARPEGKSFLSEASAKSKSAKSEDSYTEIIDLCRSGLEGGLGKSDSIYARQLIAWAHNRRGELRADEDRAQEALDDFEAAVALNPKLWRAAHNRGVSYAAEGKYAEALQDFNRALQINTKFANGYFNRGEIRYEQGDFNGAIRDYSDALRLSPQDAGAYNSRGHASYRLGRFRDALADYTSAIRLDPENAAAYTNRGDAYADLGSYAEAARDYRAAIKIDPALGRAYQSAAWLMATCPDEQFRDVKLAVEAAGKAIELDGWENGLYLETLAAAQANAGDYELAQVTQARAVSLAAAGELARSQRRLELYKRGQPYREGARQTQPQVGSRQRRRPS
jgi:tetratricopeptide (TPR) repeat protein